MRQYIHTVQRSKIPVSCSLPYATTYIRYENFMVLSHQSCTCIMITFHICGGFSQNVQHTLKALDLNCRVLNAKLLHLHSAWWSSMDEMQRPNLTVLLNFKSPLAKESIQKDVLGDKIHSTWSLLRLPTERLRKACYSFDTTITNNIMKIG